MNYLDYIIIAIVVFYGLWGLAKGFLRLVLDLAGYIIAFMAAKWLSPYLIDYVQTTNIPNAIHTSLFDTFKRISPTLTSSIDNLKIQGSLDTLTQQEPALRDVFHQYPTLKEKVDANMIAMSGNSFMETITTYLVSILCVVAIFLLVKIIFSVITSIMLARQDYMPLAVTNRIFGMLTGLLVAGIVISFSLQLIQTYALTSSPVLSDTISQSKYGHIFTNIPILDYIQSIIPK